MHDKTLDVLVVEDDEMLRTVMGIQLRLAGIPTRSISNGEQALKLIQDCVPSLLILDIGLPNMSGFDLVEQLRLDPATENLPLIVHSSQDLSEEQRIKLTLGPTKIVTKSMAFSDNLAELVHDLIGTACK